MRFVDESSLALTLDAVNEALFFGRPIPRPARVEAATWIARRQGLPGSYANMFAPTEQDFVEARILTGEITASRAALARAKEGMEARLAQGMREMKARRLGTGKWHCFPFFYAVLALTEIDLQGARAELRYAAPVLERYLQRSPTENVISRRRHAVAERALALC